MHRFGLAALACGLLALAAVLANTPTAHNVRAQTSDQLAMLALTGDDLPAYAVISEDATPVDGYSASFSRVLDATDPAGSGNAEVSITLLAAGADALGAARTAIGNGTLLSDRFGDQAGFQSAEPLNSGEIDAAAGWQRTAADGTPQTVYGDAFLRGSIVAIVTYAANADLADPAAIGALAQQQDGKLQAVTTAPSPAPAMTAPLGTPAPATPSPSPSATVAAVPSPSPTVAPKPLALSTSKALQQVALQQVDFPSFERDGYVKFDATTSNRVLALYGDIWEQDTPQTVTFVIERLETYDTPLHAQVGSFAPYEDVVNDATIAGASRLPSLGIGDIDYTLSYQLVDEHSGEKFQAFEESAVVGSTVVDITVVNSSNFVTVNDAALYARIVAGRVANAQR